MIWILIQLDALNIRIFLLLKVQDLDTTIQAYYKNVQDLVKVVDLD